MPSTLLKDQFIPLTLTVVIFGILSFLLWVEVTLLNLTTSTPVIVQIRWFDILIGLSVYLKTSIDFAIYIGNLMAKNNGWKSRIAIESGTALGNALGTMIVLAIWVWFKEVKILLVLMVFIAALVLFKLAEESLEHTKENDNQFPRWFNKLVDRLEYYLSVFNRLTAHFLKYILPSTKINQVGELKLWPLLVMSFTVPFILGLDDFAGYVSLFSVVNVFGFAIGVFLGHMILNICLYLSPQRTIKLVKNPIISFVGTLAFIGLGIWGLVEVVHLIGF